MCGIFGYVGNKQTAPALTLAALKTLEYRGYDSWGIAAKRAATIVVDKHTGKISAATTSLKDSHIAIGHTRWATHGGVTRANAHPHISCNKRLAVVHNGIVENFQRIKKDLLSKGHSFSSDTDTEVIVHLVEELHKKHGFATAVRMAFEKLDGLNAIVVMNSQSKEIVAVKNGSPLLVARDDNGYYFCSDISGVMTHTNDVYYMKNNEMVICSAGKIQLIQLPSAKIIPLRFKKVKLDKRSVSKGKYKHYLEKEICDQPGVIAQRAREGSKDALALAAAIRRARGTFMIGCGTAAYACMAGTYFFSRIAREHINFSIASEFEYLLDYVTDKTLVMPISQSGETIDVTESVDRARQKGARSAALTNVQGSTLARMSDVVIPLNAGVERAVISTKGYIAMVSTLLHAAYAAAGDEAMGKKTLEQVAKSIKKLLKSSSVAHIKKVAKHLHKMQHIYILGRGSSYPVALEFAIKIKETTYIHAEGFAGGELKHGVIALIEKGTPVIVLAPLDETYDEIISNAQEVSARGGYIIGVSPKPNDVFDEYIPVEQAGEGTSIVSVVVGQMLAYQLALEKGFEDPDKPRNLAKSVTVK